MLSFARIIRNILKRNLSIGDINNLEISIIEEDSTVDQSIDFEEIKNRNRFNRLAGDALIEEMAISQLSGSVRADSEYLLLKRKASIVEEFPQYFPKINVSKIRETANQGLLRSVKY